MLTDTSSEAPRPGRRMGRSTRAPALASVARRARSLIVPIGAGVLLISSSVGVAFASLPGLRPSRPILVPAPLPPELAAVLVPRPPGAPRAAAGSRPGAAAPVPAVAESAAGAPAAAEAETRLPPLVPAAGLGPDPAAPVAPPAAPAAPAAPAGG